MGNSMKRHRTSTKDIHRIIFEQNFSIFLSNSFRSSLSNFEIIFIRVPFFPAVCMNKDVPFETEEHKSSKFLDCNFNSFTRLVEFFTRFGIGRGMCKRLPTGSKQRSQRWERWSWENATGFPSVILPDLPNSCIHRSCKECFLVAQASKSPRCSLTASLLPRLIPFHPRSEPPSSSTRTSMDFPSEMIDEWFELLVKFLSELEFVCCQRITLIYIMLILKQLLL